MLAVDTCMKLYRVGAASCKMPKMLWSIRKDIEWSSMFFWLLFHHHFGAAEDSRSQSNQRMAQTALTQMLSAVAPKFARCKMRLTKFTEHSIFFFKSFRGNCSHFASGHYSADGVEFSWHAALTWICKVSLFSKCFWSSLIKCSECCFSSCAEVQPSWWSLECWLSAVTRCLKSEDISSHVPLPCFKIECTICFPNSRMLWGLQP